jgi:ankyrin repeat protein
VTGRRSHFRVVATCAAAAVFALAACVAVRAHMFLVAVRSDELSLVRRMAHREPWLYWIRSVDGCTPTGEAAKSNARSVLHFLIESDCDVNAKSLFGVAPLHEAARRGYAEAGQMLLDAGARVDIKGYNRGNTPLHIASAEGRENMVRLLIQRGASLDATDSCGTTPLMSAVQNDQIRVAVCLLSRGAQIDSADKFGDTALSIAKRLGHREIAALLDASDGGE